MVPAICLIILGEVTSLFDSRPYVVCLGFVYLTIRVFLDTASKPPPGSHILMDVGIGLVAISEIISYFFSTYRPNSFHALFESLFLAAFYWIVRSSITTEHQLSAIVGFIVALAFYLDVKVIYFVSQQYEVLNSLGFPVVSDLRHFLYFLNPPGAPVAEWITIFLILMPFPVLLWVKFRDIPYLNALLLLPIATGLIVTLLTFSRGIYAGTLTFVIVAIALSYFKKVSWFRSSIFFGGTLIVLICVFLFATPFWQPVRTTFSVFGTQSQVRSFEGRLTVWSKTAELVRRHPVLGIGANNFAMQYATSKDRDAPYAGRALNLALNVLVERGFLGLAAYAFLFLAFFGVSFNKLRALQLSPFYLASVILFISVCVAILVRDLSYSSILTNRGVEVLLWFIFANTASLTTKGNQEWDEKTLLS